MSELVRIAAAVMGDVWAIDEAKGRAIAAFLDLRLAGEKLPEWAVAEAVAQRPVHQSGAGGDMTAVIPMVGILAHRSVSLDMASSQVTSTVALGRAIDDAARDDRIGRIVLDVDSPGGVVSGTPELAAKIRAARDVKPVIAVANTIAGSAAYWLASQASEIVVSPSGEVGSVGVYTMHRDESAMLERDGKRVTLISAGKHKTEGNPYEPLSDDARAAIQASVDAAYEMFVSDVAKGRGVKASDVRAGFGEGRMVKATDAVNAGMADRVATLEQVLSEGRKRRPMSAARARLALA